MIKRIDHVSLAVHDYEKAASFFTGLLGLVPGAYGSDESGGFFWQLFSCGDLSRFELITPTGEKSFLDSFLSGRSGGVHHITFQVEDISATAARLRSMNVPYFGYNDKYDNWKELFIHPRHAFGLLIQFSQFTPGDWLNPSMTMGENEKWRVGHEGRSLSLKFTHPGGGVFETSLDASEVDLLIADLTAARNRMK